MKVEIFTLFSALLLSSTLGEQRELNENINE